MVEMSESDLFPPTVRYVLLQFPISRSNSLMCAIAARERIAKE
jgi:hypothetical protein